MAIQFRSPVLKPLLRANAPLPPNRGSVFRVTQQFNSRDFYWNDGRTHSAVDIGDFGCGAAIVAMAAGTAIRVKDNASQIQAGATDALGVRITHGVVNGQTITTEYWHLGGYSIGDVAQVAAGQQIGVVGNTGLGAVCHCHIEAKRNGVKFDPEPLMFGGSLGQEDDVDLPNGLVPLASGTVGKGNNLRVDPATREGAKLTDKDYRVHIFGRASGQEWTIGNAKGTEYLWVGVFDRTWFVAEPLVTQIALTGAGRALLPAETAPVPRPADCSAQDAKIAAALKALQ